MIALIRMVFKVVDWGELGWTTDRDEFAECLHGPEEMLLGGFGSKEMHKSHGQLNSNVVKNLNQTKTYVKLKPHEHT